MNVVAQPAELLSVPCCAVLGCACILLHSCGVHVCICCPAQIGMSKERMLRIFHPDAIDMLNITNSLKQLCEQLASPTYRMARKVG